MSGAIFISDDLGFMLELIAVISVIMVFSFFQALKNADEEIDFQTDFVNEIARFVNNPILKC